MITKEEEKTFWRNAFDHAIRANGGKHADAIKAADESLAEFKKRFGDDDEPGPR